METARKKPIQYERNLQIMAVNYIRGAFPHVLCAHVPNGGSRNVREGANLKRMGVLAGMPDLLIWWPKGMGAIELKADKGKLTEKQEGVLEHLARCNVSTAVCRSVSEVEEAMTAWGLKPLYHAPKFIAWSERP